MPIPDQRFDYDQTYQDMPDCDLERLYIDLEEINKGLSTYRRELTPRIKALLRAFLTGKERSEIVQVLTTMTAETLGVAFSEELFPLLRALLKLSPERFPSTSARLDLLFHLYPKPFPTAASTTSAQTPEIVDTSCQGVSFTENIELHIGLSDSSRPIANLLKLVERVINQFQIGSCPSIRFRVSIEPIEVAREEFQNESAYDIIMIDDPWIPAYYANQIIHPLGEESEEYLRQIKSGGFREIFIESLYQVCYSDKVLMGLPILGNVQMLIQRLDACPARIPVDIDSRLRAIEALPAQNLLPLVRREQTDNEIIQAFWEILRALGHEDNPQEIPVSINRETATEAALWMHNYTIGKPLSEIRQSLMSTEPSQMPFSLGWPGWMSGQTADDYFLFGEFKNIKFQRLATNPVMGAWILALPERPRSLQHREYSRKIIHALTTNSEFQFLLAQQGNVPVLKEFNGTMNIMQIPFWRENYSIIRDALRDSRPRPRTSQWFRFEHELANQVRKGEFQDIPGLLTFSE
jgi:hypothetical protein